MSRPNPSWGALLGPDAQVIAAYMLAATGADAQVDSGAEPVSWKMPCRNCNGGVYPGDCVACASSGTVVRMRDGHQVPDLIGEVDEDVIVDAARALLASVGSQHLVVHSADVVNNLIAQQEHGAELAREQIVGRLDEAGRHAAQDYTFEVDLDAVGLGSGDGGA